MKTKSTRRQELKGSFNPKGTEGSLYPTHSVQGAVLVATSPFLVSQLSDRDAQEADESFAAARCCETDFAHGSGIGRGPKGGEQAEADDYVVIGPFADPMISNFTPIVASVTGVAPDTIHAVSAIGVKKSSCPFSADNPSAE